MRIVHLSHFGYPKRGGIETYIDNASTALAGRGHEVFQVLPPIDPTGPPSRAFHPQDQRITQIRVPELWPSSKRVNDDGQEIPGTFLRGNDATLKETYTAALRPVFEEITPDKVFVHLADESLASAAYSLTRYPAAELFYVPHMAFAEGNQRRAALGAVLNMSDVWSAILPSSTWHREWIVNNFGPSARVKDIAPGIDLGIYANPAKHNHIPVTRGRNELWVLCPSRISDLKGQHDLVRSIPAFVERGIDIHTVLAAPDDQARFRPSAISGLGKVVNEMKNLGVEERVLFLPLGGCSMAAAMHSCDVVYSGSHRSIQDGVYGETFGIVGLETLAAGRPLTTTNSAGVHEYIDSTNATVIASDPNALSLDPIAIVDGVLDAYENRERYAVSGPATAQTYSLERFGARLADVLALSLDRSPGISG